MNASGIMADIQVWARGVRYVRPVVAQVSGGWFHYATPRISHWEPSYAPICDLIFTWVKSPDAHSGSVDTVSQHRLHPLTVAMTRNSNISITRICSHGRRFGELGTFDLLMLGSGGHVHYVTLADIGWCHRMPQNFLLAFAPGMWRRKPAPGKWRPLVRGVRYVRHAGAWVRWTCPLCYPRVYPLVSSYAPNSLKAEYILFAVTRCGVLWAEYVLFAVHEVRDAIYVRPAGAWVRWTCPRCYPR